MAFNFGGGTGGFSFSTPATTTAGTTGFSFASPTSTASGGTGGFTFTPPTQTQTTGSCAGFVFTKPAASTGSLPLGGNFAFPAVTSNTQSAITTTTGQFAFNAPATTAPATDGGAAKGAPVPSFGLGSSLFGFPASSSGATQGAPGIISTTTGGSGSTLSSLFAAPTSQVQQTLAPTTSLLAQAVAKPPTLTTSLPTLSGGEGLFSNVATSAGPPSLTPASTPLLGTAPAATPLLSTPQLTAAPTVSLTSAPAATAPLATLTTATSTHALLPLLTGQNTGPHLVNSPEHLLQPPQHHHTPISQAGIPFTSSASAAAATAAVAPPTLSVHGLEEKVNKWVGEIREQEERLMRQAAHVNSWDQLLQQGHDQVQQLRDTLNKVKMDQQSLQAELDFIQGQQQELEQLIEPLESAVVSTTPAQHQGDRQRDNMHHLAQNLDAQLHQMTDDLCKVIEHLNSNNSGSQATDPVNTVARVLSAHMDTLKWVDQNSALLTQKIEDISRTTDSKRRD